MTHSSTHEIFCGGGETYAGKHFLYKNMFVFVGAIVILKIAE